MMPDGRNKRQKKRLNSKKKYREYRKIAVFPETKSDLCFKLLFYLHLYFDHNAILRHSINITRSFAFPNPDVFLHQYLSHVIKHHDYHQDHQKQQSCHMDPRFQLLIDFLAADRLNEQKGKSSSIERRQRQDVYKRQVLIPFHADRHLDYGKQAFFRGGYLFLQSIYYQLQMNKICRKLKHKYKFKYDINAILSDLIYARILEPCSCLLYTSIKASTCTTAGSDKSFCSRKRSTGGQLKKHLQPFP